MSTMREAARVLMTVAVLLGLDGPALGQVLAPTAREIVPATPVRSDQTFIARSNHWTAWLVDGKLVFIEDDGGGFNSAIIVNPDTIDFGITSEAWQVTPGASYDMQISIDGQVFSGTAIGTNNTTVQMRNINRAFLQNLYWGRSALIRVNQHDLVLSLTGSKAIIDAGLRYLRGG
ncbi:hypothetical protein FHP25_35350 [Vineibacter terrae]|uniref:Uncharacterized protein n=1 Tax=Vineibacter terrae TaxID=2586908 RepID=A0A5C8P958_9HYPH|nr:hypothetical protein [Vineibacter terrae]TXL70300.1 hypothetical protein FHP25_35350 [Vineibacter terrae]